MSPEEQQEQHYNPSKDHAAPRLVKKSLIQMDLLLLIDNLFSPQNWFIQSKFLKLLPSVSENPPFKAYDDQSTRTDNDANALAIYRGKAEELSKRPISWNM